MPSSTKTLPQTLRLIHSVVPFQHVPFDYTLNCTLDCTSDYTLDGTSTSEYDQLVANPAPNRTAVERCRTKLSATG